MIYEGRDWAPKQYKREQAQIEWSARIAAVGAVIFVILFFLGIWLR